MMRNTFVTYQVKFLKKQKNDLKNADFRIF